MFRDLPSEIWLDYSTQLLFGLNFDDCTQVLLLKMFIPNEIAPEYIQIK